MTQKELRPKSPREAEIERLEEFPSFPNIPLPRSFGRPSGVLLGDQIEYFCRYYGLLYPYRKENIKAANYELRVGYKYVSGGIRHDLKEGETLKIRKFDVAVIEILETVNMPPFLIGRWNIRTKWAYEGLIWVGGPQVDAGYRGSLMCPLWNLSNKDFEIRCGEKGEPIAVIDFVATTPLTEDSTKYAYDWRHRNRFVFDEYVYDEKGEVKLKSGLVEETEKAIRHLEEESESSKESRARVELGIEQARNRIDSVTSVMFTALGVLIAAIAVFATKPQNSSSNYWWDPTVFFLCWATTVLALAAWIRSGSDGKLWWAARIGIGILVFSILGLQLHYQHEEFVQGRDRIQGILDKVDRLEKANARLQQQLENGQQSKNHN